MPRKIIDFKALATDEDKMSTTQKVSFTAMVSIVAGLVSVLSIVGSLVFMEGKENEQVENLTGEVSQLKSEIDKVKSSLNVTTNTVTSLRVENATVIAKLNMLLEYEYDKRQGSTRSTVFSPSGRVSSNEP